MHMQIAFRRMLEEHYEEPASEYDEALTTLNDARTRMLQGDRSAETMRACFAYYRIICMVEPRFFIEEKGPAGVVFTWQDNVSGQRIDTRGLTLDKAGALYNAAAVATQLAVAEPRDTGMSASCLLCISVLPCLL